MWKNILIILSNLLLMMGTQSCSQDKAAQNAPTNYTRKDLTCEYIRQTDNCWRVFASQVKECLPDQTATGKLSADRKSCVYESGAKVELAAALGTNPMDGDWNLTVYDRSGSRCLTYLQDTSKGSNEFTASSGSLSLSAASGFSLKCPDYTEYYTSSYADFMKECTQDVTNGGIPLPTESGGTESFTLEFQDKINDASNIKVLSCAP